MEHFSRWLLVRLIMVTKLCVAVNSTWKLYLTEISNKLFSHSNGFFFLFKMLSFYLLKNLEERAHKNSARFIVHYKHFFYRASKLRMNNGCLLPRSAHLTRTNDEPTLPRRWQHVCSHVLVASLAQVWRETSSNIIGYEPREPISRSAKKLLQIKLKFDWKPIDSVIRA